MYSKITSLILVFFLTACSTRKQPTQRTTKAENYCHRRVRRLFKVSYPLTKQKYLTNIHKIYNKKLYENLTHLMISYPSGSGIDKTIELKWDQSKQGFQVITSFLKDDFEKSLSDYVVKPGDILKKLKKYSVTYKQSFYYFGLKRLNLIFEDDQLYSSYLGADFNCRFDNAAQVECTCSKWFR